LPYWYRLDQLPVTLQLLNDFSQDMLIEKSKGIYDIKGGLKTEVVYAFPEGIAFYSSLLTSIWLWLHIISYVSFRLAIQTDALKSVLLQVVNIDGKPFSALATMIIIVYIPISILCVLGYAFFNLINV